MDGVSDTLNISDSVNVNLFAHLNNDSLDNFGDMRLSVKFTTDSTTAQKMFWINNWHVPLDFLSFAYDSALTTYGYRTGQSNIQFGVHKNGMIPIPAGTKSSVGVSEWWVPYNSFPSTTWGNQTNDFNSIYEFSRAWLEQRFRPKDIMYLIHQIHLNNNTGIAELRDLRIQYLYYIERERFN
jgi:hypothetical protein